MSDFLLYINRFGMNGDALFGTRAHAPNAEFIGDSGRSTASPARSGIRVSRNGLADFPLFARTPSVNRFAGLNFAFALSSGGRPVLRARTACVVVNGEMMMS